jgi:dTMP kinase
MGKIGTEVERGGDGEGGEVAVGPPTPERMTGLERRFRQEEEDLHVIDASPSVEEVAEEVWKVVRARVEAVERGEVGTVVRKVS